MKDWKVIAEIGGTHIGSLDRAKKLAQLAKISGADVLKTQKRYPKESVKKELWNQPHPNKMYAYGDTYLEHRENLEMTIQQHLQLKTFCDSIDIEYSTSVWDITSAKEVAEIINPKFIKIPSACNHNKHLLNYLLNNYNGEVHISLGMTTQSERLKLYKKLMKWENRVVIYHCTSGYPVPFKEIFLKEIETIKEYFSKVGFSNHGLGIALEPVAYTLGARYFERHFIDDRTFPHTDSVCSVEPVGLNKICRDIKAISEALQNKPDQIIEIEKEQRDKLRE